MFVSISAYVNACKHIWKRDGGRMYKMALVRSGVYFEEETRMRGWETMENLLLQSQQMMVTAIGGDESRIKELVVLRSITAERKMIVTKLRKRKGAEHRKQK